MRPRQGQSRARGRVCCHAPCPPRSRQTASA
jgi:hypothetical protein